MKELLTVKNLNKHFDGIKALDDFSCTINQNEIVGLIGPNGAGKSTLFNVITGFIQSDSGLAHFKERKVLGKSPNKISKLGISRIFQNLRLIRQMTVLENVLLSFKNQPGEELGNIFFKQKLSGKIENENRTRAMALLKGAGIAEKANDLANNMSYGQQKLLSIVCCLAAGAELLLLDEPVAGIAPEMIEKILTIITGLPQQGKAVIIIEHNMDAISRVCNRVVFMDAGQKVCEGTPEEVRNDPQVIEAYLD
ncbi:MAG: ABC transporter ATP-binding protein [Proteobacteria bacterium]|nr:ABC transporter ATP-binding protein [Pseudomonadota bacterium]